jgi:hypothetical protein
MAEIITDWWPQITCIVGLIALGAAFRTEVNTRLKVLEEKVKALFLLWNNREK